MFKRTTVYLEEDEVETLKKISFLQNVSMAELIRRGVQGLCKSFSEDQKEALNVLAEIRGKAKASGVSAKTAMEMAIKAQQETRRERKKSRR